MSGCFSATLSDMVVLDEFSRFSFGDSFSSSFATSSDLVELLDLDFDSRLLADILLETTEVEVDKGLSETFDVEEDGKSDSCFGEASTANCVVDDLK